MGSQQESPHAILVARKILCRVSQVSKRAQPAFEPDLFAFCPDLKYVGAVLSQFMLMAMRISNPCELSSLLQCSGRLNCFFFKGSKPEASGVEQSLDSL